MRQIYPPVSGFGRAFEGGLMAYGGDSVPSDDLVVAEGVDRRVERRFSRDAKVRGPAVSQICRPLRRRRLPGSVRV